MPPQPSGIADYSYDLLTELSGRADLVAVVSDDVAHIVRAPAGVTTVGATAYGSGAVGRCDIDVYHMGNHPWLHAYIHGPALDHPGLLVLHDPALADFYCELCGGTDSPVYLAEFRYDDPSMDGHLPMTMVDGRPEPDRLRLLMSRRLVETSIETIVHSEWIRDELIRRYPSAKVSHVHHPARTLPDRHLAPGTPGGDGLTFGVFGGLSAHKRVGAALRAFTSLHHEYPDARMAIVGRSDDPELERQLRELIGSGGLSGCVRLVTNVSIQALEREIAGCDVVVALRWPTAGETSGVMMRAFGAGKPVIVSDVPQYRGLDPTFCWAVPTDSGAETPALEQRMRAVLADPASCAAAGAVARAFVATEASFDTVASRYLELAAECVEAKGVQWSARVGDATPDRSAVSLVGNWLATTGLAEAARRSASALIDAGVGVSIVDYPVPDVPRSEDRAPEWMWRFPSDRTSHTELWYLNVNELGVVADDELRPPGSDRYVVASWFWELPRLAAAFVGQIDRVDEIWAGSKFTASAFRGYTLKPVHVIPCVVEPKPSPFLTRSDLDLPEDACLFLYSFDANSTLARKNPWGAIRAFRRAFGAAERRGPARLVIKSINLGRMPLAQAELIREIRSADGILIDEDLSTDDMHALISLCDVYVSLHRSEGFGLGMAEAMYLGKPVIATAFSGNMDYMTEMNSCLVGYRLREIDVAEHRYFAGMANVYETGQLWAEPDVEQAAQWMRRLFENPAERLRIGATAAGVIRQSYNPHAAAAAMTARFAEIEAALPLRT
ncbi:MAG: glycosyltransferase family 4 protein [Acidimicrobiales bacterium]